MATESNLQKIHVFPNAKSYEQNQGSIGADDIAFVPDDSGGNSGGGIPVVTTSGTGAAYTATVPGVTELTAGLTLIIVPHTVSTTTGPTLNVNGLGAKRLVRYPSNQNGTDGYTGGSSNSWIYTNCPIIVSYSTVGGLWVVLNNQRPVTKDINVSTSTDYTDNQVRGISLQTFTPSSIRNGSIVGVYST